MDRSNAVTTFLVLVLCGGFLAGCLDEGPAPTLLGPASIGIDEVEAGRFYAFDHRGGSLAIGIEDGDELALHLYSPQDTRLGRLELAPDTFGKDVRLDGLAPGSYVIGVEAINGTLALLSSGASVELLTVLGSHVERSVIAEVPISTDATFGIVGPIGTAFGQQRPVDESLTVNLSRTPTFMGLLFGGETQDLDVKVTGATGTVLTSEGAYAATRQGANTFIVEPLPSEFSGQGAKSSDYDVRVTAPHFEGVLILEAYSYSRHVPANPVDATSSEDDVTFTYGELPGRPVSFQVHKDARALYAWAKDPRPAEEQEACIDDDGQGNASSAAACGSPSDHVAYVAVYGPDDERLGIYRLVPGTLAKIPVARGGDYVAVSHGGLVVMGADKVPVDFEMHVLDVSSTMIGQSDVGDSDDYEQVAGRTNVSGVAFSITPAMTEPSQGQMGPLPPFFEGCPTEGRFRVLDAGNETLGFWGPGLRPGASLMPLAVPQGDIVYVQDGMGGRCGQTVAEVHTYHR